MTTFISKRAGRSTFVMEVETGRTFAVCSHPATHASDAARLVRAMNFDSRVHGDGPVKAEVVEVSEFATQAR